MLLWWGQEKALDHNPQNLMGMSRHISHSFIKVNFFLIWLPCHMCLGPSTQVIESSLKSKKYFPYFIDEQSKPLKMVVLSFLTRFMFMVLLLVTIVTMLFLLHFKLIIANL